MESKTNSPLVALADDGELRSSTEVIAAGMEYEHASTIKLVRKYEGRLSKFGLVRFQIRPRPAGQHGGGDVEYAELNEPQAALLISMMRNKPRVLDFKEDLVFEFFRMRSALQQRDMTFWQQRLQLEARDRNSFEWASFGSRKMLDRRRAMPGFRQERADLDAAMQQPIPGVPPVPPLQLVGRKRSASNDGRKKRVA